MPVRTRAIDRGTARGRALVAQLCRELEDARTDRGLSYAALGRVIGISGQQVGRICQGRSPEASLIRLAQLFALVGLQLSAKGFPSGQPIRDAGHTALLERFRRRLAPTLEWRLEVPVVAGVPEAFRDLRAWDATLSGIDWTMAVEAETNVRDVQALERRLALKLRDGSVSGVILLLSETRHHRELLRSAPSLRETFPVPARVTMGMLSRGEQLPGSSIVVA